MAKPEVVLQSWSLHVDEFNPYTAPELLGKRLSGKVYGDSRFEDGTEIVTSRVIRLDPDNDLAETSQTIYRLGAKSEDYKLFLADYSSEV